MAKDENNAAVNSGQNRPETAGEGAQTNNAFAGNAPFGAPFGGGRPPMGHHGGGFRPEPPKDENGNPIAPPAGAFEQGNSEDANN